MPYTVKFPNGVVERYDNVEELEEKLSISRFTVNSLLNGTCSFTHNNTKPLKGIIIQSTANTVHNVEKNMHEKKIKNKENKLICFKKMLEKYENMVAELDKE
jgi:hypothetical protein